MCAWVTEDAEHKRAAETQRLSREQHVARLFDKLDSNKDGSIDELEFSFLRVIVPEIAESDVELTRIFREADTGSGHESSRRLNRAEFTRLVDQYDLLRHSEQICQRGEATQHATLEGWEAASDARFDEWTRAHRFQKQAPAGG